MSVGFSGPRLSLNHGYIRDIRNCSCYCIIIGIDSLNHKRHVLSLGVGEIKGVRIVRSLTDTTVAAHTQRRKTDSTDKRGEWRKMIHEQAGCSPQNVSRQKSERDEDEADEAVQRRFTCQNSEQEPNERSAVCGLNEWLPRACVVGVATYYTGWPENL